MPRSCACGKTSRSAWSVAGWGWPIATASPFSRAPRNANSSCLDRRHFGNIVEKWDIAEGGANSKVLGRIVSHGSGGCAAVHIKKMTIVQHGHQLVHQCGIGGRL